MNAVRGESRLKFGYTIFYVDDVAATIAFYEAAFGFTRTVLMAGEYGELDTGATKLSFADRKSVAKLISIPFESAGASSPPPPVEIGFVTDDVLAAFDAAVAKGAAPLAPPAQKPWGQTVAYVRDLNGFLIEICTPMGG